MKLCGTAEGSTHHWATTNAFDISHSSLYLDHQAVDSIELQDRRSHGLWLNYDDKFSRGHRCKRLFFIEGIFPSYDEQLEDEIVKEEEEEEEEEEEVPEISFHAISGNSGLETMRVIGKLRELVVSILLDTCSTHNFLNSKLPAQLGLYPKKGDFSVQVTDGYRVKSGGLCKDVPILVQGITFHIDLFILPVEGCDVIFGTQLLKRLGLFTLDLNEFWMRFNWEGRMVELRGMQGPSNKIAIDKELRGHLRKGKESFFVATTLFEFGSSN
ncbi:unnamed protein product [Fraxinus pennsylvanica]|uniref:Uncharacterized protein n=1 Tax=Fraxinus pennsylvanica TaxID=56036 RepID=A0AAD1ZK88_9LAMI|nr:unnamed protein product [Fraxinus pennsylvanica]